VRLARKGLHGMLRRKKFFISKRSEKVPEKGIIHYGMKKGMGGRSTGEEPREYVSEKGRNRKFLYKEQKKVCFFLYNRKECLSAEKVFGRGEGKEGRNAPQGERA